MEIEKLLKLRNNLCNTELGTLLNQYLSDTITSKAVSSSLDALEIKGMCRLHQVIKDIPREVERLHK